MLRSALRSLLPLAITAVLLLAAVAFLALYVGPSAGASGGCGGG